MSELAPGNWKPARPIEEMQTVADLIDAFDADPGVTCHPYRAALKHVLRRLGTVNRGKVEWSLHLDYISKGVYEPTSPRPLDKDGGRIIHGDSANIRLAPLLADFTT